VSIIFLSYHLDFYPFLSGGEYRYSPYKVAQVPLCEGLATDTYVYPDFAANSDFPLDVGNNCPLPAVSCDFIIWFVSFWGCPIFGVSLSAYNYF